MSKIVGAVTYDQLVQTFVQHYYHPPSDIIYLRYDIQDWNGIEYIILTFLDNSAGHSEKEGGYRDFKVVRTTAYILDAYIEIQIENKASGIGQDEKWAVKAMVQRSLLNEILQTEVILIYKMLIEDEEEGLRL